MNDRGGEGIELWTKRRFLLRRAASSEWRTPLSEGALVGGTDSAPAVETLEQDIVDKLPGFKRRMQWFIDNHPDVANHIEISETPGQGTDGCFLW